LIQLKKKEKTDYAALNFHQQLKLTADAFYLLLFRLWDNS